jgi:hypothetical protein
MCDALSLNVTPEFATLLAHCLAHYPEFALIRSSWWKANSDKLGEAVSLRIKAASRKPSFTWRSALVGA